MEGGWNGAGEMLGRALEGNSMERGEVARLLVDPALAMAKGQWPQTLYKLKKNFLCLEDGWWMSGGI